MKAVVTAGGRIDGDFAAAAGTNVKALAPIAASRCCSELSMRFAAPARRASPSIGGADVRDGLRRAGRARSSTKVPRERRICCARLRAWPDEGGALLYATSDLPYVTAADVGDFAARVEPGALAVALAEFGTFNARFPGAPAPGITLAGERVVNGGLFSIPAGSAASGSPRSQRASSSAQSALADGEPRESAGFDPLLSRHAEHRASRSDGAQRVTQVPAHAVRNCAPELAFDVDTIAEYRVCLRAALTPVSARALLARHSSRLGRNAGYLAAVAHDRAGRRQCADRLRSPRDGWARSRRRSRRSSSAFGRMRAVGAGAGASSSTPSARWRGPVRSACSTTRTLSRR